MLGLDSRLSAIDIFFIFFKREPLKHIKGCAKFGRSVLSCDITVMVVWALQTNFLSVSWTIDSWASWSNVFR